MHDVFVSYSHSDKDWVRTYLVPLLRSWGLSVAVDHMNFIPGQKLIRKILDSINDSKHVLFVCTPAFLRSKWCREELETVYLNDPDLLKAIPLVLDSKGVPELLSEIIWCNLDKSQNDKQEWEKLCDALGGTWREESTKLLTELFDVAGFFGGFLNNTTTTYLIARSHGSQYTGVQAALGIETAQAYANVYAVLSRHGKAANLELVLSDDVGETTQPIHHSLDANYIIIGGTSQALELIPMLGGRNIRYIDGETKYYQIDDARIDIKQHLLSFLIYKNRTAIAGNIIYLFSPWALGGLAAARTFNTLALDLARAERDNEFLHIYETEFSDHEPVLTYRHDWR